MRKIIKAITEGNEGTERKVFSAIDEAGKDYQEDPKYGDLKYEIYDTLEKIFKSKKINVYVYAPGGDRKGKNTEWEVKISNFAGFKTEEDTFSSEEVKKVMASGKGETIAKDIIDMIPKHMARVIIDLKNKGGNLSAVDRSRVCFYPVVYKELGMKAPEELEQVLKPDVSSTKVIGSISYKNIVGYIKKTFDVQDDLGDGLYSFKDSGSLARVAQKFYDDMAKSGAKFSSETKSRTSFTIQTSKSVGLEVRLYNDTEEGKGNYRVKLTEVY